MSSYSQGFKKALGIAAETVFNTHVAAASWLGVKEGVEIVDGVQMLDAEHLSQAPYGKDIDLATGQRNWSAKFDCAVPVRSLAFKELLKGLFGGVDTEGSDPYTHTFVLGTAPLVGGVSLTQFLGDDASMIKASGGRVRGLTLKAEANGFLTASFDMVGATYLAAAEAGSPALAPETPAWFKFSHCSVKVDTVATEVGGFQLDIKPGLSMDTNTAYVLGTATPSHLDYGSRWDISGNLTRRYLDDTPSTALESQFLTLARARSVHTIEITCNAGSNMTLVMSLEAAFDLPTRNGTGIIVETVPFKMYALNTGGNALGPFTAVWTDDEATPIDAP